MLDLASKLTNKVLAAITFENANDALWVAELLLAEGLSIMEVPLRTKDAIKAIAEIKNNLPEMCVGAGTILSENDLIMAKEVGADFGLSPGFNPTIAKKALEYQLPFIPGVLSPSEIEVAYSMGFMLQKIFPIAQLGGIAYLNALKGPYAHTGIQFIPMGGVSESNCSAYQDHPMVAAIGGSYLVSPQLISKKNTNEIRRLLRQAIGN